MEDTRPWQHVGKYLVFYLTFCTAFDIRTVAGTTCWVWGTKHVCTLWSWRESTCHKSREWVLPLWSQISGRVEQQGWSQRREVWRPCPCMSVGRIVLLTDLAGHWFPATLRWDVHANTDTLKLWPVKHYPLKLWRKCASRFHSVLQDVQSPESQDRNLFAPFELVLPSTARSSPSDVRSSELHGKNALVHFTRVFPHKVEPSDLF